MAAEGAQLIYFVSGMWCSTCAKNVSEAVSQIAGVESADINYASKLLLVRPKLESSRESIDQMIQARVARIGFGILKQSPGWVLDFHKRLQDEKDRKVSWTFVSLVWFMAMWSSMLAFAGYLGGDLTTNEHYLLAVASSAFGLPAILFGIVPFGKAGLRALFFSRLLTLDLFIFFGGLSAVVISILSLLARSNITYADSGSMIIAILLLMKKIEISMTSSITSNLLFQLAPGKDKVEVQKNGQWVPAEVSQIKKGHLVRFFKDQTICFDGVLEGDGSEINNHLINGEPHPFQLKKGDHVFAGAVALTDLQMIVTSAQGERKIDRWAETALLAENRKSKYSKFFSKIESSLVLFAFFGAVFVSAVQTLRGAGPRSIIESFFVGILIFCPCLFASIIPLAKQIASLSLFRRGILIFRTDALFDLHRATNFYFDKTGTLEAVESQYVPFDTSGEEAIPYLNSLAKLSKHPIFHGLKVDGSSKEIKTLNEFPGRGLEALAIDGKRILVGRASFLKGMGFESVASSDYPLVSINGVLAGQISIKSLHDEASRRFLKNLVTLVPNANLKILSGDPSTNAGRKFTELSHKISYLGNLSPEDKAREIQSPSVFVGDGLNDTLALAKADVAFRMGHRTLGFAPVDFHLQRPNLGLILMVIHYSGKYRKVLLQTAGAALIYNGSAFTLAAMGKFSPLGAVLSRLGSFSIMLFSVSRLSQIPEERV